MGGGGVKETSDGGGGSYSVTVENRTVLDLVRSDILTDAGGRGGGGS